MRPEQEMRQILAQLELLSHGRTQRIDANRVHSSKAPAQLLRQDEDGYPHDVFREEWNLATTDMERAEVFDAAKQALLRARRAAAPKESHLLVPLSVPWRRAVANDRRPIAVVAREWMTSRQTVRDCIERYREDEAA